MNLAEVAKGFEGEEWMAQAAADINGIPMRTLQDWCQYGLLDWPGQGTGNRRKFDVYDLILIGICKSLLGKGFKTALVKRVVRHFSFDHPGEMRRALSKAHASVLVPVPDDSKAPMGRLGTVYYKYGERPSGKDAEGMLDQDSDATVTVNIGRIAERVLANLP
jgi:DNA-binding transcriptional MerR regulator